MSDRTGGGARGVAAGLPNDTDAGRARHNTAAKAPRHFPAGAPRAPRPRATYTRPVRSPRRTSPSPQPNRRFPGSRRFGGGGTSARALEEAPKGAHAPTRESGYAGSKLASGLLPAFKPQALDFAPRRPCSPTTPAPVPSARVTRSGATSSCSRRCARPYPNYRAIRRRLRRRGEGRERRLSTPRSHKPSPSAWRRSVALWLSTGGHGRLRGRRERARSRGAWCPGSVHRSHPGREHGRCG